MVNGVSPDTPSEQGLRGPEKPVQSRNEDLGTQVPEEPFVAVRSSERPRPEVRNIRFRENPLKPFRKFIDSIPAPEEGPSILRTLKDIGTGALNLMEAASGEVEATPEAIFKDALDLSVGQGAIAFNSIPRNALGTFGGRIGNRNLSNIQVGRFAKFRDAQLIEGKLKQDNKVFKERGLPTKSNDDIQDAVFSQTGWFRSPLDGQWRFHIDDSQMEFGFNKSIVKDIDKGTSLPLGRDKSESLVKVAIDSNLKLKDVMNHPQLFDAYPQLRDTKIRFNAPKGNGRFFIDNNTISLSSQDVLNDLDTAKSILLHEIQHNIQFIEKFKGRGANPVDMIPQLMFRLRNVFERIKDRAEDRGSFTPEEKIKLQEIAQIDRYVRNPGRREGELEFQLYQRDPGEIESRVVQQMFEDPSTNLPSATTRGIGQPTGPIPIIRR